MDRKRYRVARWARCDFEELDGGKPVIRRTSVVYVSRDVEPNWNLRESGQHMQIEGVTPLEIAFTNPSYAGRGTHGS